MNTSIQIQSTTKQRLSKFGTVSSTYDSVINQILDHVEICRGSSLGRLTKNE